MKFKPTPQQHLYLWCLAVEPGRSLSKTLYKLDPTSRRDELKRAGLIEVTPHGRSKVPALTEEGWYALEQNLGAPLANAGAAATVLQAVLTGVLSQIQRGRLALTDVVPPPSPESVSGKQKDSRAGEIQMPPTELKRRVYDACRHIAGDGIYNVRIRLADLRAQLADVPRPAVDEALKDLERNEDAALYTLDDPREIRADDEEAALSTSSGAKRHILYLSRPR